MKKIISAILSIAVASTTIIGMAVATNAEEYETEYMIPYVSPEKIPTIDGTATDAEWNNALQIEINKDTEGMWITDTGDETQPPDNAASLKAYILWSSTLDGIEDPIFDYFPTEDPVGGLYFRFEVTDTTRAFANGEWGTGEVHGDRNAIMSDGVRVLVDPSFSRSGAMTGYDWSYIFTSYSAANAGVGQTPSGDGFWWEDWALNGGEETYSTYGIQIKTSSEWEFDPNYLPPEDPMPDPQEDHVGWVMWKLKKDTAFDHVIALKGYTIEVFLPWIATNYTNSAVTITPAIKPTDVTQFGMGLILVDGTFDWENWEANGSQYDQVQYNWSYNFCKASFGNNDTSWADRFIPSLFNVFQLQPSELEGTGGGSATGDINADGSTTLADVLLAAKFAAKIEDPTPDQIQAGDINTTGSIELADVLSIAKIVAKS